MDSEVIKRAISRRNSSWEGIAIPKWVDTSEVGLDQFFTNEGIAKTCYDKAIDYLAQDGVSIEDCFFVEPSAGNGSFFNLLPRDSRIGIDICPLGPGIKQEDFLTWSYEFPSDKKIVYIGNPPFGYRGWLALEFMNRCGLNADYVFFILPMSFQSVGKGSPRLRVKGLSLKSYERIPKNSYYKPDGKRETINALWTIWKKGENKPPKVSDVSNYIDLFTVDLRKERLCGIKKMRDATFFLQRTFYDNDPPRAVEKFSDVKYVCGYGFIVKRDAAQVRNIIDRTDWFRYSNLAAHNCHHISMYHIKQALNDGGISNV